MHLLGWVVLPPGYDAAASTRYPVLYFTHGFGGSTRALVPTAIASTAIEAAGLSRQVLASRGADAVLKMVLIDGYFHADPHPGNVFYLPGNRLAFIDFGMMGRLSDVRRDQLLSLMLGLVQRDPEAVVEVLMEWTEDAGRTDMEGLQQDVVAFVDQYRGTALAKLSLGGMMNDVTTILREYRLALPADLALLVKTFITLEGLGRSLAPDFHMATEAEPLLEAAVRARYSPRVLAERGGPLVAVL